MEVAVLRNLHRMSLENVCLVAHGFGRSHGSPLLYEQLEKQAASYHRDYTYKDLKMLFHGFVYNYRISKNFLKALKHK
jgi:hypothetical protein